MNDTILEVHRLTKTDDTPLQLISADLLKHYRRCERELAAYLQARRDKKEVED